MGMAPFGALLAGGLAGHWGAPKTVAVGGAICAVGSIAFRWRLPKLRSHALQLIVAQESAGGAPADAVTGDLSPAFRRLKDGSPRSVRFRIGPCGPNIREFTLGLLDI